MNSAIAMNKYTTHHSVLKEASHLVELVLDLPS